MSRDDPHDDRSPPDHDTIVAPTDSSGSDEALDGTADLDGIRSWLFDRGSAADDLSPRYRLGRALGRGGMGEVREARDRRLLRSVAVKSVRRGFPSAAEVHAFLNEAQVTSQLEHPNIPPVYDVGIGPDGVVFFTMKRVQGRTLKALVEADGPQLVRKLAIFQKVCDAIAYAHHAGVLHLDLKPANIMVGAFGEVYVLDWGLAELFEAQVEITEERSDTGGPQGCRGHRPVGTPGYMPPEQVRGERDRIDERADIYALGAILNYLLVGTRAFDGRGAMVLENQLAGRLTPPRQRDPDVPWELDAVVLRAMSPEPRDRYPSVEALRDEVERFLGGVPLVSVQYSAVGRLQKWAVRHRAVVVPVVATAMAAGTVLVGVLLAHGVRLAAARDRALQAEHEAGLRLAESEVALSRMFGESGRTREALDLVEQAHRRFTDLGASPVKAELAGSVLALRHPPPELELLAPERSEDLLFAGFDGQGRLFAAADGEIWRHDVWTGDLLDRWTVEGKVLHVWDINGRPHAVRRDGADRLVVTDLEAGRTLPPFILTPPPPSGLSLCTLDEGRMLAVGHNGATQAWRVATGEAVGVPLSGYKLDHCAARSTRVLVDGPHTTQRHRSVDSQRVVDLATGEIVLEAEGVYDGVLSPSGRYLVRPDEPGTLVLVDVESQEMQWSVPHHRAPKLLFGASEERFLSVDADAHRVEVRRTRDGALLASRRILGGPAISKGYVVVSSAADRLVSVRQEGISVWSVPRARHGAPGFRCPGAVTALAVSPDGQLAATAGWDGEVLVWDWRSGTPLERYAAAPEGSRDVQFSPDGRRLAVADRDGAVRIFDLEMGSLARTLQGPPDRLALAAVFAGDAVVVGYEDGQLAVWAPSGDPRTLKGSLRSLWGLELSSSGHWLVSSGRDGEDPAAEVWDTRTWEVRATTARLTNAFRIAHHPHEELFAVADGQGRPSVHRTTDGEEVARLSSLGELVQAVAWSPDGALLAVGAYDGTVAVVDRATWSEVLALEDLLARSVVDLAFVPGSSVLLAASGDGEVAVLDLDARSTVVAARLRRPAGSEVGAPMELDAVARAAALRQDWTTARRALEERDDVLPLRLARARRLTEDLDGARSALSRQSPGDATLAIWRRHLDALTEVP